METWKEILSKSLQMGSGVLFSTLNQAIYNFISLHVQLGQNLWPARGGSLESCQVFSEYTSSSGHACGFLNILVYAGAFKGPILPTIFFPTFSLLGFSVLSITNPDCCSFPHIAAIVSIYAFKCLRDATPALGTLQLTKI